MSRSTANPGSTLPEAVIPRNGILSQPDVALVETGGDPSTGTVADVLSCTRPGKRPCFLLLWWEEDQLAQVEMFFTEAEARACRVHGRIYELNDFALPAGIQRFM